MVAETWDGVLNDIDGFHVRKEPVFQVLDDAGPGPVAEGTVGGGTGMVCRQSEGGIGTSSRVLLPNERISPIFKATAQTVEEAIVNALVAAETMTGINGNTASALPHDRLREILRTYNWLAK